MTIEEVPSGTGGPITVLTECPVCGHRFRGREKRPLHIAQHDPEDFGLSPLSRRAGT